MIFPDVDEEESSCTGREIEAQINAMGILQVRRGAKVLLEVDTGEGSQDARGNSSE